MDRVLELCLWFLSVVVINSDEIQVYFTSDEYYTQEGAGRVVIGIVAERPYSFGPEDIFVEIYLTPDDATEGQDYFPLPQETVKLYDWPNTTLVTVGIIDDKLMEGEERFNIHLRDVRYNHTVIGRPNLAEVIIEDNDEVCPNGWLYFRRSCYLFINESLSFEAAESACSDEEACLASSTSAGENHFIANTITKGQRSWIGGSDLCRDDYWQWDNGDPWRYTNWRHGEPNNALPTIREHCLEINYVRPGLWNNHFCHRPKSAVCKCPLP